MIRNVTTLANAMSPIISSFPDDPPLLLPPPLRLLRLLLEWPEPPPLLWVTKSAARKVWGQEVRRL